jgi:hypothetical protein
MKTILALFAFLFLSQTACGGAGDPPVTTDDASADTRAVPDAAPTPADARPASCDIPDTYVTAYEDCGGPTKDGFYCVATCGELPPDGGLGSLVAPGCLVEIGTSTPKTAICVSSCGECR